LAYARFATWEEAAKDGVRRYDPHGESWWVVATSDPVNAFYSEAEGRTVEIRSDQTFEKMECALDIADALEAKREAEKKGSISLEKLKSLCTRVVSGKGTTVAYLPPKTLADSSWAFNTPEDARVYGAKSPTQYTFPGIRWNAATEEYER
jgi:hypothetical protein